MIWCVQNWKTLQLSGSNFILLLLCHACWMSVQQALVPTCAAAESSHSLLFSFHCVSPCSTPRPWLVCSTEWKPLNSVSPSESYPSWLPVHGSREVNVRSCTGRAVTMVCVTAKGGRGGAQWEMSELVLIQPGVCSACGAVLHNWVVNPIGSWKTGFFFCRSGCWFAPKYLFPLLVDRL